MKRLLQNLQRLDDNLDMTSPKAALRRACHEARKNLPQQTQRDASQVICAKFLCLQEYKHATHLALYHAKNGEVDLKPIWHAASLAGKTCYFPAMNPDKSLSFLPASPDTPFCNNRFGIPEPDVSQDEALLPEQLAVIITPVVAFDAQGARLGMGGGYYDRTLAHHRPRLLMGVAYEFQRQAVLEMATWDVPLTLILTEKNAYWSHT